MGNAISMCGLKHQLSVCSLCPRIMEQIKKKLAQLKEEKEAALERCEEKEAELKEKEARVTEVRCRKLVLHVQCTLYLC